jgi:hypothetical protein
VEIYIRDAVRAISSEPKTTAENRVEMMGYHSEPIVYSGTHLLLAAE